MGFSEEDPDSIGFFSWLMQRIDKPADQSVLLGDRRRASETMVTAGSAEHEEAAAAGVRRDRARRRSFWFSLGRLRRQIRNSTRS